MDGLSDGFEDGCIDQLGTPDLLGLSDGCGVGLTDCDGVKVGWEDGTTDFEGDPVGWFVGR